MDNCVDKYAYAVFWSMFAEIAADNSSWCLVIAKFHYTDPTGPTRTFLRRNSVGSVRVSLKVRAGPVGSGRARVVEFSYNESKFRIYRHGDLLYRNSGCQFRLFTLTLMLATSR